MLLLLLLLPPTAPAPRPDENGTRSVVSGVLLGSSSQPSGGGGGGGCRGSSPVPAPGWLGVDTEALPSTSSGTTRGTVGVSTAPRSAPPSSSSSPPLSPTPSSSRALRRSATDSCWPNSWSASWSWSVVVSPKLSSSCACRAKRPSLATSSADWLPSKINASKSATSSLLRSLVRILRTRAVACRTSAFCTSRAPLFTGRVWRAKVVVETVVETAVVGAMPCVLPLLLPLPLLLRDRVRLLLLLWLWLRRWPPLPPAWPLEEAEAGELVAVEAGVSTKEAALLPGTASSGWRCEEGCFGVREEGGRWWLWVVPDRDGAVSSPPPPPLRLQAAAEGEDEER